MVPFYSRYDPTSKGPSDNSVHKGLPFPSKKRKLRDEYTQPGQDLKKSRKSNREQPRHAHNGVEVKRDCIDYEQRPSESVSNGPQDTQQDAKKSNWWPKLRNIGDRVPPSVERPVRKQNEQCKPKGTRSEVDVIGFQGTTEKLKQPGFEFEDGTISEAGRAKNKKRKKADEVTEIVGEDSGRHGTQQDEHVKVRSKFERTKNKNAYKASHSEHDIKQDQKESPPSEGVHGLEPLPHPPPASNCGERATFSSLPPWLANPLRVDSGQAATFSSLGLDFTVLENVKRLGLEKSFPIQSAVMSLLIDGPHRHLGDVCISAATGSGKTLAYVLPMIQHLGKLATTKLRGVIVVPTRELVRQVRETCENLAIGTSIKFGTGLGSRSLHDEQEALVETYQVYDPEKYGKRHDAPVDWSKVNLCDILSELETEKEAVVDFVTRYRARIDVLICTPGRLVDHIRSTRGFTLDDVQWLVIDEADRLLNESFQEWTDFVIPALQSRAAHALQDNILHHMRLEIPERIVRKVILSATLTQDISKLNSLKMRNPKLVVVGDLSNPARTDAINRTASEPQAEEGSTFNLPSTLSEYVVPVGDGAEKPLYLLELLRTNINVFNLEKSEETRPDSLEDEDETSSSDSPPSDSESTSSSSTSNSSDASSIPSTHISTMLSPKKITGQSNNTALIFTRSTESAKRLNRLLSLLSGPISSLTTILTKSSTSSSTHKALANFRQHNIRVIIATDRASRGLDLSNLGHVISYDVPTSMTTYIHRVGRTARAGKFGTAWTLLAHREARWFWHEIGQGVGEAGRIIRNGKVQRLHVDAGTGKDDGTRERYERALKTLGEEVVDGSGMGSTGTK